MILLIWPIIAVGWVINIFQRGTASVKRIDELLHAEPAIDDRSADSRFWTGDCAEGRDRIPPSEFQLRRYAGSQRHFASCPRRLQPRNCRPDRLAASPRWSTCSRDYTKLPRGSLFIDGRPVRDYPLAVLRRNIGMVPQETFLFSETIRENLAFGAPVASSEELLAAC